MREQLNSNPLVQVAVVGVLLLAGAFFFLSTTGGGEEEEGEAGAQTTKTSATLTTPNGSASIEATVTTPVEGAAPSDAPVPLAAAKVAPPPPRAVIRAFHAGRTVVLLFVRDGGIDDALVKRSVDRLERLAGTSVFVVKAHRIARYAAITQGVALNRVPALVVLRPKRGDRSVSTATVRYGFQSAQSVVQAVVDAGYKGPTLAYHP